MAEIASGGRGRYSGHALVAHAAYTAGFRGKALLTAVAIALAESRGNPMARKNDSIEDSVGLWQINIDPRKSWGRERARQYGGAAGLMDPYANARAAYNISSGGKNFNPWSTYKQSKNSYTNWLGKAATAIRKIGQNSIDPSTLTMGNSSSRPTLRRGSRGSDVRRLQEMLGGIKVDGKFGPQTEGAVRAYQRRNGLSVDGVVGPQTWGSLYGGANAVRSTPAGGSGGGGGGGGGGGWVMPVPGGTYSNDWGNPRSGGRSHAGTDIFAPRGTPIRAPVSGKIKTSMYGDSKGMGGYRVWLEGDDGYDYYFAHMNGMPTVRPGQRVSAGTMVGRVGTSGNAEGTSPHLHLGVRRRGSSQWVNPYTFLQGSSSGPALVNASMGADMAEFSVGQSAEDLAYSLYGAEAKFFLEHRELGPIIRKAAEGGWDTARLEGAVAQTKWWRTTSQTERAFRSLQRTDPQTARQQIYQMRRIIERASSESGVNLGGSRANELAVKALVYGWTEQDIMHFVVAESRWRGRDHLDGQIAAEWDWIKERAAEWGVPISSSWAHSEAKRMLTGKGNREGVDAHLKQMARSRYPWLKSEIESGITVRQYAEPYIQQTADLLEMSPTELTLKNPYIRRMLDYQADGERRSMTLAEATDFIRGTNNYMRTDQARDQYSTAARGLAQMFGATY